MADAFQYDVFLSHSSKDKAAVRAIAERLRVDGVKVWFDKWVRKPSDSLPAKIQEGLRKSVVTANRQHAARLCQSRLQIAFTGKFVQQ